MLPKNSDPVLVRQNFSISLMKPFHSWRISLRAGIGIPPISGSSCRDVILQWSTATFVPLCNGGQTNCRHARVVFSEMAYLVNMHHCCTRSSLRVLSSEGELPSCPNLHDPMRGAASRTINDYLVALTLKVCENKLADVSQRGGSICLLLPGRVLAMIPKTCVLVAS